MASILNIGVSALQTFQRALNTTGHNIANVDTPGYSRQRAELATQIPQLTGAGWIGSGVKTVAVERSYDAFLTAQVRSGQSASAELGAYFTQASQLDQLFADPDVGLDPALQGFFDATQELANDPGSVAVREAFLSETESLVGRFHSLDDQLDSSRDQVKDALASAVDEINGLARSIADINGAIVEARGRSAGGSPNDLLDRRDALVSQLSERVGVNTVMQDDGAMNLFIGKGQTLVIGTQFTTLEARPAAADVRELEIAIAGSPVGQNLDDQLTGGEIGGLLGFRQEVLDPSQNQLGLIAAGVADFLNGQHRLGIDLEGQPGGALFSDPQLQVVSNVNNSGGSVTAAFDDVSRLTGSDYELGSNGGDTYTLTRLADGVTTAIDTGGAASYTTSVIDGFTLTIDSGAVLGDSTLIRPTRTAASDIRLQVGDVRRIAAAAALSSAQATDAGGLPLNTGSGIISQPLTNDTGSLPLAANGGAVTLTFDAANNEFTVTGGPAPVAPLAYDPATDSGGKTFSLFGFDISVSGFPDDTDAFVVSDNTGSSGDNRNALRMADLQQQRGLLGGTASLQEGYGQLVSNLGTRTRQAETSFNAQQGLLEHSQAAQAEVSGVNLDEEAANLVRYQQAYQAAAQVISVGNSLFDSLLGAMRR